MSGGFDRLAPYYDRLARLVFGRAIVRAQTCFFTSIPRGSAVLVLGGGTGWIIDEIRRAATDCDIWYVEASAKMLDSAQDRCGQAPRVRFIHGTEHDLPAGIQFDVVITNFYLDLFSDSTLKHTLAIVGRSLRTGSTWLVCDFVNTGKWWQRLLLWGMYRFFGITCRIEAKKLPQWQEAMRRAGISLQSERSFYGGFIKSVHYGVSPPEA